MNAATAYCPHTGDCGHGIARAPLSDLSRRMVAAGYEWEADCEAWRKCVSRRIRTARKDHKSGRIKAGQRYVETTYRDVDGDTGRSVMWTLRFVVAK